MERNKHSKALSMNLMISFNIREISRVKEIIQAHEINNKVLRERVKAGCRNGYEKQKLEHQIHNNRIIIRGMAQYIIELRSQMKTIQRNHSLNNKKKDDTNKK